MKRATRTKLIIAALAALIILPILFVLVSTAQKTGKTEVSLEFAPEDSTVTINGEKSKGGTLYLKPGTYTFKVSHNGYADASKTVTVGENKTTVRLLPQPDSQATLDKLEKDTNLQAQREELGSQISNEEGQKQLDQNPILSRLPFPYNQQEFAIGYKETAKSKTGIVVQVEGKTTKSRNYAIQKMEAWGYDPSDLVIDFQDFNNPLGKSEVHE